MDKIEKQIKLGYSVFLGLPLRLGISKITNEYLPSLKSVFQISHSVGIAGG
jgi:Peptidase family C54